MHFLIKRKAFYGSETKDAETIDSGFFDHEVQLRSFVVSKLLFFSLFFFVSFNICPLQINGAAVAKMNKF